MQTSKEFLESKNNGYVSGYYQPDEVYPLMDDFSKIRSIEFDKWKCDEGWTFDKVSYSGEYYYSRFGKKGERCYSDSTEDLYQLFIDSKNKK